MKNFEKISRPLSPTEIKVLKKIRATARAGVKEGYKVPKILLALTTSAVAMALAVWLEHDLLRFVLGTFSVMCFAMAFVIPFESFKNIRKTTAVISNIDEILNAGIVEVSAVSAINIALAKEYDDEGDLYIVDLDTKNVLYLWDNDRKLKKNFPSLSFEIYPENFYYAAGRQINPLTEQIAPLVIDAAAKSNYFKRFGSPEHLSIEKKNFERLVQKMKSFA